MAATLASVCSVPLTSVLLLFELTKDYRILLPLMVVLVPILNVMNITIAYISHTIIPNSDVHFHYLFSSSAFN